MSHQPSNLVPTMKVLVSVLLFQVIAFARAGVIVPTAEIIEGPSSKTTLVGPDGSVITSEAKGAKIVADGHSAIIAGPATTALLKSADQPAVLQTNLQPLIAAPTTLVETHVVAPAIASKTVISEHGQFVAHGHSALIGTHVEPLVAQSPVILAKIPLVTSHLQPVVAAHEIPVIATKTAVLKSEPVLAREAVILAENHIGSKTTISEQSQTILHPHTSYIEPVVPVHTSVANANAAILKTVPVVAAKSVPAVVQSHLEPAVAVETKAAIIEPAGTTHIVDPVVSVVQTHSVIGAKTTVSEHAQAIAHPSTFVYPQTAVVDHYLPVVAKEVVPVIGTKTTVLEPSQSALYAGRLVAVNSLPVVGKYLHAHPVVAAHSVPVISGGSTFLAHSKSVVHPERIVAVHSVPAVAQHVHVHPIITSHTVPVIGAKTTVSENGQVVLAHAW